MVDDFHQLIFSPTIVQNKKKYPTSSFQIISQTFQIKCFQNQIEAILAFVHSPLPNPLHPLQREYYLVYFS